MFKLLPEYLSFATTLFRATKKGAFGSGKLQARILSANFVFPLGCVECFFSGKIEAWVAVKGEE